MFHKFNFHTPPCANNLKLLTFVGQKLRVKNK